ncbi:MAG: DUF4157 domain-containing protein, partial [Bacteroidales bacterium]|nr:DUF4157 domain-containing protein [Bacteroidales bacterium]
MRSLKKNSNPANPQNASPFFQKKAKDDYASNDNPQNKIQPKLTIGSPGDKYEQEADAVANHVVSEPKQFFAPSVQASFFSDHDDNQSVVQDGPKVQKKSTDISTIANPLIQTAPFFASNNAPEIQESNQEEIQTKEDEEIQASFFSDRVDRVANGDDSGGGSNIENKLNSTKGSGSPLPSSTQQNMEGSIGADFSSVRVHTDSSAVQMSQDLGARAFTHGNDIYFNNNQYQPETTSGQHLLAHELTHTVQQGASVQKKDNQISQSGQRVQRGWFGRAVGAVGGAFKSAAKWAGNKLNAAKDWLLGKLKGLVAKVPGYKLFTVVLGKDPVTGKSVKRNGRNFIEAGLDIIP